MNEALDGGIPKSVLFTVDIRNPARGLRGWVAIHSHRHCGACGGVRIHGDATREEVELLARAMTCKYCFHEIPIGGAKGAIALSSESSPRERAAILRAFGERLRPLIHANIYTPWTDMNCCAADLIEIYRGAGENPASKLADTAYPTALSTFSALKATAEHLGIRPGECRVTIEGLGSVGSRLAREIDRWGGILIGVSTRFGAVMNDGGLGADAVLAARERAGDAWVTGAGDWERIPKKDLFGLPMTIHVPCAGIHSVSEETAAMLGCRAVVPGANVPCTDGAVAVMRRKDTLLLPDFVVNSGGIVGPQLERLKITDDALRRLFRDAFEPMFARGLRAAEEADCSVVELAEREAARIFHTVGQSGERQLPRRRLRPLLPTRISRARALSRCVREINGVLSRKFS